MGEVAETRDGSSDRHWMTAFFVTATLLLQVFIPYHRYVRYLKWLTICLLSYAAVLFTVHVPWSQVLLRTAMARSSLPNAAAAAVVIAIFGTTISPYLFFWQASEEVEDMQLAGGHRNVPLVRNPRARRARNCAAFRWDT